jgi:hypothetical protein
VLTKNSEAAQPNRARKRAPTQASAATAAIHEPGPDWVPLQRAPLYCTSNGYTLSTEKWMDDMTAEVEEMLSRPRHPPTPNYPDLIGFPSPKWSIRRGTKKNYGVWIEAMQISTLVAPRYIFVSRQGEDFDKGWLISGCSDEILKQTDWEEVPSHQRLAALWHKRLLEELLNFWHRKFVDVVKSGAVHIMARKNSILAPFERVTWDQWQFFTLDCDPPLTRPVPRIWGDPRERYPDPEAFTTARGPANERLYMVHIAPGDSSKREDGPEEKCRRWLLELLQDYPDRQPEPLESLCEKAVSMFPGLAQRGFWRCFSIAKERTGNRNWSKAGALKKSRL